MSEGDRADPRLRDLYAAPPSEFTAARDRLARALSAEGDPDASRVKRLRRPPLALWLLNALARERPRELSDLFAAGDRMRQGQVRALRGEPAELRAAGAAFHERIEGLVAAAREVSAERLGREPGPKLLGDLERALRETATAGAATRAALQDGVLDRLPEPGGLELLAGLTPAMEVQGVSRAAGDRERAVAAAAAASRKPAVEAQRERARRRAAADAKRLARAEAQAEDRLRDAERKLLEAQRRVEAARREAESAHRATKSAQAREDALEDGRSRR